MAGSPEMEDSLFHQTALLKKIHLQNHAFDVFILWQSHWGQTENFRSNLNPNTKAGKGEYFFPELGSLGWNWLRLGCLEAPVVSICLCPPFLLSASFSTLWENGCWPPQFHSCSGKEESVSQGKVLTGQAGTLSPIQTTRQEFLRMERS